VEKEKKGKKREGDAVEGLLLDQQDKRKGCLGQGRKEEERGGEGEKKGRKEMDMTYYLLISFRGAMCSGSPNGERAKKEKREKKKEGGGEKEGAQCLPNPAFGAVPTLFRPSDPRPEEGRRRKRKGKEKV